MQLLGGPPLSRGQDRRAAVRKGPHAPTHQSSKMQSGEFRNSAHSSWGMQIQAGLWGGGVPGPPPLQVHSPSPTTRPPPPTGHPHAPDPPPPPHMAPPLTNPLLHL